MEPRSPSPREDSKTGKSTAGLDRAVKRGQRRGSKKYKKISLASLWGIFVMRGQLEKSKRRPSTRKGDGKGRGASYDRQTPAVRRHKQLREDANNGFGGEGPKAVRRIKKRYIGTHNKIGVKHLREI